MASRQFRPVYALLLIAVMAFAVAGWWLLRPAPERQPDLTKAFTLNNEGVGLMEQFEYDKAQKVFQRLVDMVPEWLPGRINLGIAALNNLGVQKEGEQEPWQRTLAIFDEVLKSDPDNLHAHFCKGIILKDQGKLEEVRPFFEFVTRKDPGDAHAWFWLAETYPPPSKECYDLAKKALEANPYLAPARYRAQTYLKLHAPAEAVKMIEVTEALVKAKQSVPADIKYTQMGKYAEVIGRPPVTSPIATGPLPFFSDSKQFHVQLASGARWATAADFGSGKVADLRREVRKRFGGTMVTLDYDKDGKQDLFLLGAVVHSDRVRDLLLRNEGAGKFRDVTVEVGLAAAWPGLGCCVGDFNNDGYPDLLLTGAGEQRLFTNVDGGKGQRRFQNDTKTAKLDSITAVCLGALWIDLDQDSDLDLVLCPFAQTPEAALAALTNGAASQALVAFLNVGEASPAKSDDSIYVPLTTAIKKTDALGAIPGAGAPVNLAATDLDRDNDLDLVLFSDKQSPLFVLNDRLLKFQPVSLGEELTPAARWNGAVVFNADHDERSDLFLPCRGAKPLLLLNQPDGNQKNKARWFKSGITNSPPLLMAQAFDLDLDSWTDIIGLSEDRLPLLLHNDGQRLVRELGAFGIESDMPKDLAAVLALDGDDDGLPDVLLWSEKEGLQLRHNHGNGNQALYLQVTGRRYGVKDLRCNADGFGAWVVAQAGTVWTGAELTTLSAGLGQSKQPLFLGLGKYSMADVVRLHWPDQIRQAELSVPAGNLHVLTQINRMTDSCPLLFTWNGERFVFVNDILGAGAMGEAAPGGGYRPPRPDESIKIEAHQLAAKHGKFHVKIAEVRDEIAYLDHFELAVVDHLDDVMVYPDERFTGSGPAATEDLLAFKKAEQIFCNRAHDHKGNDMTATLRQWDRDSVSGFAPRAWLGYAEEHWVELDFGKQLARFGTDEKLLLCLAGWTSYPYPESIWAADQANVELLPPVLERLGKDGKWETVLPDMGFPAGLPRLITVDVTGKLAGPQCKLRVRTNMQICWDQVFVAPLLERVPHAKGIQTPFTPKHFKTHVLPVCEATLHYRGLLQEFSPDGKKPTSYDYDRLEPAAVPKFFGSLTKLGPVTALVQQRDDQFVIMGPGDDLSLVFDADTLAPVPPGWKRSFVLRACGYSRSGGHFIAGGGAVAPLPFQAMKNFPYGPELSYPQSPAHQNYLKHFNTRLVGPLHHP